MNSKPHQSQAGWLTLALVAVAAVVIGVALVHAHKTKPVAAPAGSPATTGSAKGNASLYLSPAQSSVSAGKQLTVQIRDNSGSSKVNALEADFSYPTSQLQFVSIDDSGSAYGIKAVASASNGTVKIARGNITPLTGDQPVASVTFTVKPGASGTAALTFLSSSTVVSSTTNTNILGSTTGGSYQISQ